MLTTQALRDVETATLERMVPSHMLLMALEECARKGYECRSDIPINLARGLLAPLAKLDELTAARVLRRSEDTATALLKRLNADNPLEGLYATAMLCLKLADEGLVTDKQAQFVLIGLLIITDVQDDSKDVDGKSAVYRVDEARWKALAGDLLFSANLNGLYLRKHSLSLN